MKLPRPLPSPRPNRCVTALIAAMGLAVLALTTGIAASPPAKAGAPQLDLPSPGTCPVDPRF